MIVRTGLLPPQPAAPAAHARGRKLPRYNVMYRWRLGCILLNAVSDDRCGQGGPDDIAEDAADSELPEWEFGTYDRLQTTVLTELLYSVHTTLCLCLGSGQVTDSDEEEDDDEDDDEALDEGDEDLYYNDYADCG